MSQIGISTSVDIYDQHISTNEKNKLSKNNLLTDANHHLQIVEYSESESQKIDGVIATSDKASLELLEMIATQQKAIVQAMFGINSNPEKAIAQALYNSIDMYAQKLAYIEGWTNGGVEMFNNCLEMMFENLNSNKLQGVAYEDMFQLILLDILVNAEQYRIPESEFRKIGELLEKTGSSSHTNWDYFPAQLGNMVEVIWKLVYDSINAGRIPQNSIAYRGMMAICDGKLTQKPPSEFMKQFTSPVYNNANGGGWIYKDKNTNLSPMVRIVILSNLNETYSLSPSQVEIILNGSIKDINREISIITDEAYTDCFDFLFNECGRWHDSSQPIASRPLPDGVEHAIDYAGLITTDYLQALYSEFPGRELSQEEIEEINRIGDQVKMIQEALKYWIGLVRDEQLAIVRNIG